MGDAQHCIVRRTEMLFGEIRGIGRHQGQIAGIGQFDQRLFRGFLHRVVAAGNLHIEPPREQPFEPFGISLGVIVLPFGQKARQPPFPGAGQRDQATGMAIQPFAHDMGIFMQRPVEMGPADQMAEIVPPLFVLRIERKIVDRPAFAPGHAQQVPTIG